MIHRVDLSLSNFNLNGHFGIAIASLAIFFIGFSSFTSFYDLSTRKYRFDFFHQHVTSSPRILSKSFFKSRIKLPRALFKKLLKSGGNHDEKHTKKAIFGFRTADQEESMFSKPYTTV